MPAQLSIIVPFFNEVATLRQSVQRLLDTAAQEQHYWEVLLINDHSSDGGVEIAQQLVSEFPGTVHLHHSSGVRGKGAAVRLGLKFAQADFVVVHDADLEYNPSDLVRLLDCKRKMRARVIHGSRCLTRVNKSANPVYSYGGRALTRLTNLLFGSQLTDVFTCYKLWDQDLIRSLGFRGNGFEYCLELTGRALATGIAIPEIEIDYWPRTVAQCKKIRIKDGLVGALTLVRVRLVG